MTHDNVMTIAGLVGSLAIALGCASEDVASMPGEGTAGAGTLGPNGTGAGTTTGPGATTSGGATEPGGGSNPGGSGAGGSNSSAGGNTQSGGSTSPTGCALAGGGNDAPLIDDMEDGDNAILMSADRTGFWFAFNDGTVGGNQTPTAGGEFAMESISGGRASSGMAAHTTGGGFTDFGAGIGFQLVDSSQGSCPYDASGYTGIQFWARGNTSVRVAIAVPGTVPPDQGGTCSDMCFDTHGTSVSLTSDWQLYEVSWSELTQQNFGAPVTFDPSEILTVQFQTPAGVEFDFWVDDILFAGGVAPLDGGSSPREDAGMAAGDADAG